ncbi:hypothetical protein FTUN_2364 [Frigoriglobus tundricola]|uniref:Uncharacterized protein n=1 Tax=Frigoriglobus tundricola TaxID=2774151 RepID=A0A6M5YLJ3_9BACT|nr:hypothetical protein FTUN_2364 [Frigoriglobus tundricola]
MGVDPLGGALGRDFHRAGRQLPQFSPDLIHDPIATVEFFVAQAFQSVLPGTRAGKPVPQTENTHRAVFQVAT